MYTCVHVKGDVGVYSCTLGLGSLSACRVEAPPVGLVLDLDCAAVCGVDTGGSGLLETDL